MVAHAELVDSPVLLAFLTVPDFNDVKAHLGIEGDDNERTVSGDGDGDGDGDGAGGGGGANKPSEAPKRGGYFGFLKKIPGAGAAASLLPGSAPREKVVLTPNDEKSAALVQTVDQLDEKVHAQC